MDSRTSLRIVCVIILAVMLCTVFMSVQSTDLIAHAETGGFESTNVFDDLTSSTVNGKKFDITAYPYDESKDMRVIDFVEYCYSYKKNLSSNYGLYVYVYNPKGLNISAKNKGNKIQMAVSYDSEGNPNDYVKFDLQFCNKSEKADYKNLFYKFKVVDKKVNGTTFYERVNSIKRRYDVSGIELTTYGNDNATEYTVAGTYNFTGYAEGYGPDAKGKSTLSCEIQYLETITLEVHHTFYRTMTSVKGTGYQNQLDTVYFAVPKRYFDTYGKLQRIKAEWYEYKTNDIVVTSNSDFYNKASPYLGVQTGPFDQFGMTAYNANIGISLGQNAGDAGGGMYAAKWGWNLGSGYLHVPCATLYYLFKTNNSISSYDPYADIVKNGGVSSNALYEYIKSYNKTRDKGYLPIKEGTISADLFADDIDDYRKMDTEFGKIQKGYSYYDFDADVDLQKLASWKSGNPSFWDNWLNWGLWNSLFGNIPKEDSKTLSPIYTLKESDLTGSNSEIADRLMINANDVGELKNFYRDAVTVSGNNDEEKVVVLFRFATSDYYSAPVDIIKIKTGIFGSDKHTKGEAYRAWESVFFDFDIIQLTFNKDGAYKVIPVVSSPIDIVDAITPPVQFDELEWWKILLAIVLLILLIIIFTPLLPYIIKGVIWLISLPIKAVKKIAKSIEKRKEKKQLKQTTKEV